MTAKSLQLLSALLLILWLQQKNCLACREVFAIDGHLPNSNSRGIFVSENFPHSLPAKSYCVYDFTVALSYTSDVLCFRFKELGLFTVNEYSNEETEILIGGVNRYESHLIYAGNGSLIWERSDASKFVFLRPDSLLGGPLCLRISDGLNRHLIAVVNKELYINSIGRMTRFYASYEAADSGTVLRLEESDRNSSFAELHRCLDGSQVNRSLRCNSINDCDKKPEGSESYRSDFFARMSSDESYEHARCNSSHGFGTNFVLGQASANGLLNGDARLDCSVDHSRQFLSPDFRDCSLQLPSNLSSSGQLHYWLLGTKQAADPRSATCYRLFWLSRDFPADDEALTLAEPNGRVLLRLPSRQRSYRWSLAEVQLEPGFIGSWISVLGSISEQRNRTPGAHWLDDLSAEPTACEKSTFESRMPSVCSFEWSTCGWESRNLQVITAANIAREFGVAVSDHTASSMPDRVQVLQQVLRLRPGISHKGILTSRRRLPFGSSWCFEIWFTGVGYSGYSVRVEARISGILPIESSLLTATALTNRWHRLSASLMSAIAKSPVMTVTLFAEDRDELHSVLFDDLSVTEGGCSTPSNGSVACGLYEWTCSNRQECIPLRYRCDGRVHCSDASDEMNCIEAVSGQDWSIILRVVIGVAVSVIAFLALSVCLHKRRLWWPRGTRLTRLNQQRTPPPRTVTNGRLPAGLHSDRTCRRPDMPPSYDEVVVGAANSGFAVDEEPPKYDEITLAMQIQVQ